VSTTESDRSSGGRHMLVARNPLAAFVTYPVRVWFALHAPGHHEKPQAAAIRYLGQTGDRGAISDRRRARQLRARPSDRRQETPDMRT